MAENAYVNKIIDEVLSHMSSHSSCQQPARKPSDDDITEKNVLSEIEEEAKSINLQLPPPELYKIRFSCLEAWFLRSSSVVKSKFLHSLLRRLKDTRHLEVIVEAANYYLDKLKCYTASYTRTNYIYDKKLNDHNRSLERRALDEAFKADIAWFDSLNYYEQFDTLIKLLRITSGEFVNRFFIYAKKFQEQRKKKKDSLVVEYDNEEHIRLSSSDISSVCNIGFKVPDDDKSPLAQNVEKKAKILNDAFAKYKHDVLGFSEKTKEKSSKKGEKGSKKSKKSSKSSKSSRSGSRSKGKKGKTETVLIDQIQLLPIWVVKQIFSYLDQKTLKKVKHVNSYWSYVIEDMSKERSCRKRLDKAIKKMETNVANVNLEVGYYPTKQSKKITALQKRMLALAERGAIHPKLRNVNKKLFAKSVLPEGYEAFPRSSFCGQHLLATPKNTLGEIGKIPFKPCKIVCEQPCAIISPKISSTETRKLEDVPKCQKKHTSIRFN